MSHKSIRLLIEDVVKSLRDDIGFEYGRTSDFNIGASSKVFSYFCNLDVMAAVPNYAVDGVFNYSKSWLCSMAFYGKDTSASLAEDYQKILDETDSFVDQFINKLNFFTNQSDKLLIQAMRQEGFIKQTSAILTGHLLTFTVQVQDDFNYCANDLNCIVNSGCS